MTLQQEYQYGEVDVVVNVMLCLFLVVHHTAKGLTSIRTSSAAAAAHLR
jgi:hypothetical protein